MGATELGLATIAGLLVGFLVVTETAFRRSERVVTKSPSTEQNQDKDLAVDEQIQMDAAVAHIKSLTSGSSNDWTGIDSSSELLNIHDGWRETTDVPEHVIHNLYLLGGSTVQCLEVADRHTVASHLQRLLNSSNQSIRVFNRGFSGMTLARNLEFLKNTTLQRGDLVVVLFGVNDAKGVLYRQRTRLPFRLIPGYRLILGLLRLKLRLRLAHWLWLETVHPAPRTTHEAHQNAVRVAETLDEMSNLAERAGARFVACLQPNLFTKERLTERDRQLISPNTARLITLQYSRYRETLRNKPWFRDLASAIDSHLTSPYLDWVHVNSSGNQLLAKAIRDALVTGNLT